VKSPTGIGLVALAISVVMGAAGGLLIWKAVTMPAPDDRRPREVAGLVVKVISARCSERRNPGTCYRPVVSYTEHGVLRQVASRTLYGPSSPHERGERVPVLIENDGTVWIASEWERRLADRQRDFASARRFPLIMGLMLAGGAAFAMILAAGLLFFADRSAQV
jgi:hypothetical protein